MRTVTCCGSRGAVPGSIHDTAAARIWQIPRLLREYGLFAVGDKGYQGLDHDLVVTPYKGKGKPEYQRAHHRLHARLHGPDERAFAQLKKWRVPHKLRCDPHRTTQIARTIAPSTIKNTNHDETAPLTDLSRHRDLAAIARRS